MNDPPEPECDKQKNDLERQWKSIQKKIAMPQNKKARLMEWLGKSLPAGDWRQSLLGYQIPLPPFLKGD